MKCFLIFVLILPLMACSSSEKAVNKLIGRDKSNLPSEKQRQREEQAHAKFEKANRYLDRELFVQAAEIYEEILTDPPTTGFESIVLFNLGLAYEGMQNCPKAADTFRHLVKATAPNQRRLQALGLFRMSYAYECMGEDAKVISSLRDVLVREKSLPPEIGMAEAPARLAGAYARLGNRKMAERYFQLAERGVNIVGTFRKSKNKKREIMSRTLFLMGNVDPKRFESDDSLSYLYNLEYTQRYLLRAVELDHQKWSVKSAERLLDSYDQVWRLLKQIDEELEEKSSKLEARKKQQMKVKVVEAAINNIQLLKRQRFPETRPNRLLDAVLMKMVQKEKKFQAYLANNLVSMPTTKENEPRFGDKRKGRLVDPKKN